MFWKWLSGTLVLLVAALGGCNQDFIVPEGVRLGYREHLDPISGEPNQQTHPIPPPPQPVLPVPAHVNHLDREPRPISLQEAIAIALEQGTVGFTSVRNLGLANEDLIGFSGQDIVGTDNIRVLALQPAIAGAAIEGSLGRFDAQWLTSMNWKGTDEPLQGLSSFSNGQSASFNTGLAKPLATGGVAGVNFSTDYNLLTSPPTGVFGVLNPSYLSRVQFGFEQPLLRNNGVFTNQLLNNFPGSTLFPNLNTRFGTGQGILLTRIRFDQQRAELERRVNFLLLNVEVAYWNLYGAYVNLYSTDQALRMAAEVWRIAKEQYPERIDESDFAGTQGQFQFFRGNRLQAIGAVLEAERNLRILLGMPIEDGQRLMPLDKPAVGRVCPDWQAAVSDAMSRRPELVLARQDVESKRLRVTTQNNFLLPDLRFQATYTVVGLGSRLDGDGTYLDPTGTPRPTNSLRSLTSADFNNWTLGLNMNVPLGYRQEHAAMRQAKLELAQSYQILKEQETKAQSFLAKQYSRVIQAFEVIETRRLQREAYANQVEARFQKFAKGKLPVDFLQDAVLRWATALNSEYEAVVTYNNALATLEFAKGTLMEYDQIFLAEGPLPPIADIRAVEHERERTRTSFLRERANRQKSIHGKNSFPLPGLPPGKALELSSALELEQKTPEGKAGPRVFLEIETEVPILPVVNIPSPFELNPRSALLLSPQALEPGQQSKD